MVVSCIELNTDTVTSTKCFWGCGKL